MCIGGALGEMLGLLAAADRDSVTHQHYVEPMRNNDLRRCPGMVASAIPVSGRRHEPGAQTRANQRDVRQRPLLVPVGCRRRCRESALGIRNGESAKRHGLGNQDQNVTKNG
jgi:hypothetical protein